MGDGSPNHPPLYYTPQFVSKDRWPVFQVIPTLILALPDDPGFLSVDGAYIKLTCFVDQELYLEVAKPAQVVDIIQLKKRVCLVGHCFTIEGAKY
jgi:hypothetical protein